MSDSYKCLKCGETVKWYSQHTCKRESGTCGSTRILIYGNNPGERTVKEYSPLGFKRKYTEIRLGYVNPMTGSYEERWTESGPSWPIE